MKLISNRKNELAVAASDPRCKAITTRYGDLMRFNEVWSPSNLRYIANNVRSSVDNDVPSLVMMMRTYGREAIADNLNMHLLAVVDAMGINREDFTLRDIRSICELICEAQTLRNLNYAYVLAFFMRLMQGEYKIYGGRPYQIMEAFNQYAAKALEEQRRLKALADKRREDLEEYEASKHRMYWKDYAAKHGITEPNPLEIIIKQK